LYFPLKQFFSSRNPRRFEGVQRREPVKGAVSQAFIEDPLQGAPLEKRRFCKGAG
jgi:hypothetical protein